MAKIIIIDDSEIVRVQLRKLLESSGFEVKEGVDGQHGLEIIKANADASLILCDVNMPKLDGLTMCEKVHEISELKNIPIFMLTTESNPEMKAKGKTSGVIAWIIKPFIEEKLIAGINKVLKKPQ